MVVVEYSSIDTYLASLNPFRQAYPSTSLPYPRYEAITPNATTESFRDLLLRIFHIVEESTLSITSTRLSRQYRVIDRFRDIIAISTYNENPSLWSKITKRIYFLLPSKHRSDLQIEIENLRRSYRPSTEFEFITEKASSAFRSINTIHQSQNILSVRNTFSPVLDASCAENNMCPLQNLRLLFMCTRGHNITGRLSPAF